jgi:hypothetical protein
VASAPGGTLTAILLVTLGVALIAIAVFCVPSVPTANVAATVTRDPLIPTRLLAAAMAPSRIFTPTLSVLAPGRVSKTWRGTPRWGIGVAIGPITRYDLSAFSFGWYLDWQTASAPVSNRGTQYAQMVRVRNGALYPDGNALAEIARENPGALWLIGNEPDVKWQDNVEPAAYAVLYHRAYQAIKSADPTAQVAIGGVTQPSPLRLRYLDRVIEMYRQEFGGAMPVDVWNIHNFILREERGSWGVDIPPGMTETQGVLYEVDDSGNLDLFREQIIGFRRWMAERGYQNHPLIVSEYGIPMPEDYGFPPDRVLNFLTGTFDFFLTSSDPALGDPDDDDHLVQRWCWYSLDDVNYPTGRLFDPDSGKMTEFGSRFAEYLRRLRQ